MINSESKIVKLIRVKTQIGSQSSTIYACQISKFYMECVVCSVRIRLSELIEIQL